MRKLTVEWLAEQLRKASCTKCLEDRDHPWHDDGTFNPDDRYAPGGPYVGESQPGLRSQASEDESEDSNRRWASASLRVVTRGATGRHP